MRYLRLFLVITIAFFFGCLSTHSVSAVTCSITTDTVIDQAGVDAGLGLGGGACTDIEINGNVSTTWIGAINLNNAGTGTVTVKSGYTMTMGSSSQMLLAASDDLVIETSAAITHRAGDIQGVYITARHITVTGGINVTGKGCSGTVDLYGYGPVTTSTGECAYTMGGSGNGQYGGGGHGGTGGSYFGDVGRSYGSSTEPTLLGSSGGGVNGGAGQGGGRVYVEALGTLTIDGAIQANGVAGGGNQGGGSGGSVYIRAATLAGSGTVSANGGNGNGAGAPGAGGRVAIYYTSATFPITSTSAVTVTKGSGGGWENAQHGTTYMLNRLTDDGAGTLIFNQRGMLFTGGDFARDVLTVNNDTTLECEAQNSLTLSSGAAMRWEGVTINCTAAITSARISSVVSLATTSTSITFSGATSVTLNVPFWANTSTSVTVSQGGSTSTIELDPGNNLYLNGFTFTGAGTGYISPNGGRLEIRADNLSLSNSNINASVSTTVASLTIDGASSMSASGKGCGGTTSLDGYGPDGDGICTLATAGYGRNQYGGAGHGGAGGTYFSTAGSTYGSSTYPTLPGSSGGGASAGGGLGGGKIHLVVTGTLTLNGSLRANGTAGGGNQGGGSGGSINIHAGTFAGSGTISADGGAGNGAGAPGGGGRIAVHYTSATFPFTTEGSVTVTRGSGGGDDNAKNGTVYILNRLIDDGGGELVFNGGGLFYAGGDFVRDSVVFVPGTNIQCETGLSSLTVSSTSAIRMNRVIWDCSPTVMSSFTLSSNAEIDLQRVTSTFTGQISAVEFIGASLSTSSTSLSFTGATSIRWRVASFANAFPSSLSMTKDGSQAIFDVVGDLALNNFTYTAGSPGNTSATGSHWFYPYGGGLTLTNSHILASVSGTVTSLSVDASSSINASGKGCGGTTSLDGYGPDGDGICTLATAGYGRNQYGGAGHGGAGGTYFSTAGSTYGSSTYPTLPGSSGGGASAGGGLGGGKIHLVVTGTLTLNGSLRANGTAGGGNQGGGSGGSINIHAGTFAGSGTISADGGAGNGAGAPGGGGRIAYRFSTLSFSGASSTTKGSGGGDDNAADGTIYTLLLNQSPNTPTSLGQAGLLTGASTSTNNPVFAFTLSDPDGADTVRYQIQIDDDADFSSPAVDYTSALAAQGARTFQVGQTLSGGTYTVGSASQTLADDSYYWRVRTIDGGAAVSSYQTANGGAVAFVVDTVPRYLRFANAAESALESVTATSVRVFLDTTHFEDVSVAYTVTGGTATGDGTDYTLSSGVLNIAAGDTSNSFALTIENDLIDEPNEAIQITLSSPQYAIIGSNTSTVYTIVDNDTASVTVTESSGSTSVTEGGSTDSYTVVLGSQPTSTVRITFATSTRGVTLSSMFLDFTSVNWNTPQTVTVTATNDDVFEGAHSDTITHTISIPSGYAYGYSASPPSVSDVATSITDNDTAGVTLSAVSGSATEGGSTASYTIVLTSQPTSTVSVALTQDPSSVSLSASTLSFTALNWNTPQTVTITAVNDDIDEPTYTTSVAHAASVSSGFARGYNASLSISNASISVVDNDTASVTVTESSGSTSVTEGGSTDSYTVVLGSQPTSTVRITFATSTRGVTLSSMFLDFTSVNWNTPQTVTVTATNDDVFEGAHSDTITHTISIPSGYAYGYSASPPSVSDVATSITDNDTAGVTLSTTSASLTEGGSTASYTIVLTSEPTSTLTLVITPNSTGLSLSPTTLSFTSLNWNTPQTITLSPTDDRASDGTETVTVSHAISASSVAGYPLSLAIGSLTASVADNDGGGGGGGGATAGSGAAGAFGIPATFSFISPLASAPPRAPDIVLSTPPSGLALPTSPSDFPPLPDDTFVNPSDVEQLAARFRDGRRDPDAEAGARARVLAHARTFRVTLTEQDVTRLANFLVYGTSAITYRLGQGEREALIRDALDTAGAGDHIADLERRARGAIPVMRNLARERAQLPRVRATFRTIYGHDPVFSNPEENLAWNALMYRIRFPRDLTREREGILEFRRAFGREPRDPFQWATIRVMGYVER